MVETLRLTRAEENCSAIAHLVKDLARYSVELGGLLVENQENAFWGTTGHASFKDYVQELGISYDWATRMMGLARVVAQQLLTQSEIDEMGVANAVLLLPLASKGELSDEIKTQARDSTWTDLRKALGHNTPN